MRNGGILREQVFYLKADEEVQSLIRTWIPMGKNGNTGNQVYLLANGRW